MAFSSSAPTFANGRAPGAGVTAVLGPTNTGKTHLAIERMLAHSSGLIGLPLRLLAREVYNKIADRAGAGFRRADHRRGKDQAAEGRGSGSPPWRRCRGTSTCRFSRSMKSRSPPISNAAMSSPIASSTAAAATKRCCWARPPCARSSSGCCPAPASSPGRGCRSSNSPATARSRGSRGAPRSSRSRPTRSTPSPN